MLSSEILVGFLISDISNIKSPPGFKEQKTHFSFELISIFNILLLLLYILSHFDIKVVYLKSVILIKSILG